jgi:glycosyltransferase involved in cell wall biosynthesis
MISIVVPCYNEEDILVNFLEELKKSTLNLEYEFELILIDNNSSDSTWIIMNEYKTKFAKLKLIKLSNYFGKESAILSGLDQSSGKSVIIMDPDLEDPPHLIGNLIDKWNEGYEVVYTVRTSEDISFVKKILKKIFYKILIFSSNNKNKIPNNSGDFRIIDRKIVNLIIGMRERTRFLRGLVNYVGFKQIGISFERPFRKKGKSKSSYSFLIKYSFDSLFSFSNVPINLIIKFGFLLFIFIMLLTLFLLFQKIFGKPIEGFTTVLLFIGLVSSFNILAIGLVGEYVSRIYNEVKERPNYIIEDMVDKKINDSNHS